MASPIETFAPADAPHPDPEQARIAALQHGSVEALGELYHHHHVAVRAFACRLLGDASAAEDLVHEVFLGVPQAIRRFRGASSLRTFLLGIAVNLSRHHVRAASRRRAAMTRMAREPVPAVRDPEHRVMQEQATDALVRALDALSHDHRVAFVLCEVEERSAAEVSAIVGVPEATVRTRLFHAKRRLREALEGAGVR